MEPLFVNTNKDKPMLPARRAGEPRNIVEIPTQVPRKLVFKEPVEFPFQPEYLPAITKVNRLTSKLLRKFQMIAMIRKMGFESGNDAAAKKAYADTVPLLKEAKNIQKNIRTAGGNAVEIPKYFNRDLKK